MQNQKAIYGINMILAMGLFVIGFTISAHSQIKDPNLTDIKTLKLLEPELALLGAEKVVTNGREYHKIVLTVTNRDKFDPKMFQLPTGAQLPPNPCGNPKVRIILDVYGTDRRSYRKCVAVRAPESLKSPSFLIETGKPIPDFVYIVLTDMQTGVVYKSNLISPSTGASK